MKNMIKGTSIVLLMNLIANGLNYLYQTFASGVININEYGTLNTIFSFMGIVAVPGAALTMISARELALVEENGDNQEGFVYAIRKKIIIFSFFVIITGLVCQRIISSLLKIDQKEIIILTVICAGLGYFHPFYSGCLSGKKRFLLLGLYGLLIPIYKLVGLLFANMMNKEIRLSICLVSIIFGSIITAFIGNYFVVGKHIHRKNNLAHNYTINYKEWFDPFIVNLCFTIFVNADILIVRRVGLEESSGLYSSIMLFGRLVYYSSVSIGTVIIPYAATIRDTEDDTFLNRIVLITGAICAIGLGTFWLVSEKVIGLIYGNEYIAAVGYVPYVCLISFSVAIMTVLINFLIGRNSIKNTKRILLGLVFVIILIALCAKSVHSALLYLGISGCIADMLIYFSYECPYKKARI